MSAENVLYRVVVNHEDQHSIWPEHLATPDGWHAITEPAARDEALSAVARLWPDIRPRSVREQLND